MTADSATSPATITVSRDPGPDWDDFVRRARAPVYLQSGWTLLAREVFGHHAFFVEARNEETGELVGALPVVQQKSLLGNFATSVPFFNYGGAASGDVAVTCGLMERARDLARDLGCSYLELRDVHPRPGDWAVRTDKASMILELPSTVEALSKQLGSKLRSQVKRADREPVTVRSGGLELVDPFYDVFCRNMRDLGTPVYPRRFFRAILERFSDCSRILVVDLNGVPAAAGLVVFDGLRAEIPWASCRSDAKPLGMNMKLYWEVLTMVILRGCTSFDFGRSTIDSGPFKFKKQWGAQPLLLHWHRWERRPIVQAGDGALRRFAVAAWQRLPLGVANAIGPHLSPKLPW